MIDAKEHRPERKRDPHRKDEGAKLDRMADHTRGLFEDMRSWFDLKVDFMLANLRDEAVQQARPFAIDALAIVILVIGLFFGLVALALGLGAWLSHPAWGFLVVTVLLVATAAVLRAIGKRKKAPAETPEMIYAAQDDPKKLSGPKSPETSINQHGKNPQ